MAINDKCLFATEVFFWHCILLKIITNVMLKYEPTLAAIICVSYLNVLDLGKSKTDRPTDIVESNSLSRTCTVTQLTGVSLSFPLLRAHRWQSPCLLLWRTFHHSLKSQYFDPAALFKDSSDWPHLLCDFVPFLRDYYREYFMLVLLDVQTNELHDDWLLQAFVNCTWWSNNSSSLNTTRAH